MYWSRTDVQIGIGSASSDADCVQQCQATSGAVTPPIQRLRSETRAPSSSRPSAPHPRYLQELTTKAARSPSR